MSDDSIQKFPRVAVFLLISSAEGKYLLSSSAKRGSFPKKELEGGESWDGALKALKKICGLETTVHRLAGIGSGLTEEGESWVYGVFQVEEGSSNTHLTEFKWVDIKNSKDLDLLSLNIKQKWIR